ncbi:hypothetical protein SO802_010331 [Lithocarpus litseifolius]|uniref:Uncharacterized protein n=1 Tax=Lithocarpus litseifolius TaxID=425828 RepID=A0AAW2DGZ3_9ROSI
MKLKPPKESMPIEIPYSRAYPSYPAYTLPTSLKALEFDNFNIEIIYDRIDLKCMEKKNSETFHEYA